MSTDPIAMLDAHRPEASREIPLAAVMRLLSRYERRELACFIAVAIDLLDVAGGDPDLEDSDEDGQCSEDEISTNLQAHQGFGPGCIISDPDCAVDDSGCDDDDMDLDEGCFDSDQPIVGGGSGDY